MKTIGILTGTRAEYGLLKPLIEKLNKEEALQVRLIVTGAHLAHGYGYTVAEIERDGYPIAKKIPMLMHEDTASNLTKAMGLELISLGDYLEEAALDLLVVLGDRYEILVGALAAVIADIPVAHLHGGEITEGAYDECFRHAITKMSTLHFVSCQLHRQRVIQMGEQPAYVYDVGALGVENILTMQCLTKEALQEAIGFVLDKPYGVVTFHPVTREADKGIGTLHQLLKVLEEKKEMKWLFTKANADEGGQQINALLEKFTNQHKDQCILIDHLGQLKYFSAVKYSVGVIGNSSSGIIEVPSLGVPSIDIGDRQKGRLRAASVLNCNGDYGAMKEALEKLVSNEIQSLSLTVPNPYGKGDTSGCIVENIKQFLEQPSKTQPFYDNALRDGLTHTR